MELTATAVVCTRNRSRLLKETVGALCDAVAAMPGAELVIVQQGDGQAAEVCRAAGVDARVIIDDGVGASRARNLGWHSANGSVVVFTDDDCCVPTTWLTDHVAAISQPGIVASCGPVAGLSRHGGTVTEASDPTRILGRHRFGSPPWVIGHSANLAVRTDALRKAGGFDERIGPGTRYVTAGEDADLLVRLLEVGDACSGVGAAVHHLEWRSPHEHADNLVDYERGAGVWLGKLLARHHRNALALTWARLSLLRTNSPWREPRQAARHRLALARGIAYGSILGLAERMPPSQPRRRRSKLSSPARSAPLSRLEKGIDRMPPSTRTSAVGQQR